MDFSKLILAHGPTFTNMTLFLSIWAHIALMCPYEQIWTHMAHICQYGSLPSLPSLPNLPSMPSQPNLGGSGLIYTNPIMFNVLYWLAGLDLAGSVWVWLDLYKPYHVQYHLCAGWAGLMDLA